MYISIKLLPKEDDNDMEYIYKILNYMSPYVRRAWDGKLPIGWQLEERMIYDFELVYIMEGKTNVKIEGQEYLGLPGDLFFFRPYKRHSMQALESTSLRQPHIHFDFYYQEDSEQVCVPVWPLSEYGEDIKYLRSDITAPGFLNIPDRIRLQNPEQFETLLFKIISQEENASDSSILLKKAYLLELLVFILSESIWNNEKLIKPGPSTFHIERLEVSRSYITENLKRNLTLDEISVVAGFSKNYFVRLFKEQYGLSPIQFHNNMRIEQAKQLLLFSDLSITEISSEIGFNDIHSFSRTFKQETGTTPTNFRTNTSMANVSHYPFSTQSSETSNSIKSEYRMIPISQNFTLSDATRPATIIRDFVELAIQSGAQLVSVEIQNGGITYMKITDNGKGFDADVILSMTQMDQDKTQIAIESDKQLMNSLSKVIPYADVMLATNSSCHKAGIEVHYYRGQCIDHRTSNCNRGTSIQIKDIFFNCPEKYHNLRSDTFENILVRDTLRQMSMLHPNIAFSFISNGVFQFSSLGNSNISDCIQAVYGKTVFANLITLHESYANLNICGFISTTQLYFETTYSENIFVNSSRENNQKLISSVNEIYHDLLPSNRYPFVYLEITDKAPCVNDRAQIQQALNLAIKNALCDYATGKNELTIEKEFIPPNADLSFLSTPASSFKVVNSLPDFTTQFDGVGLFLSQYIFLEQNHTLYFFNQEGTIKRLSQILTNKNFLSGDASTESILKDLAQVDAYKVFDSSNPMYSTSKNNLLSLFK